MASVAGDRLWPRFGALPFRIDLLTPEGEVLINAPPPLPGLHFTRSGDYYVRESVFAKSLEATMGLDGPTIVIGTPAGTAAKTSTRWVITLLHEHFHQLQQSQPGLYEKEMSLGLAHGDTTGMWMLNYAFPYAQPDVDAAFATLQTTLEQALEARGTPAFAGKLASYRTARRAFAALLKPDDYRYFAFQLWTEGVARYTEYRAALAAASVAPLPEFAALPDATPFSADASATLAGISKELHDLKLVKDRRVCFYSVGAAEALLLDEVAPGWRLRYFNEPFDTAAYFPN